MKKQNLWWTILLLIMFVSLGTLQAQTTYGTKTYSDGSKYVGEYKDNKMHGKGTITSYDGQKMKGVWIDGELVGKQFE